MSLGENIKLMRQQKGMSQEELASRVGTTRSQISNIERGFRKTTTDRMVVIADALGCNVADLYDEEEKKQLDEEGKRWAIFNKKMKEKGYTPEDLEKWLKVTEQFMKRDEDK